MRYEVAAVAIVGLLVLGFGGSFVLSPSAATTAEPFRPIVETGRSEGAFYAGSEVLEKRSIAVGEHGTIRTEATFANITGVRYWNGSNESVYRVEATNESAVDRVVDAYNESEIVSRSEGVAVVEEVRERPEPEEWWNDSLVLIYLKAPEYERVGTETRGGDTVVVYEPSSSFARIDAVGEQTVRVANPAGEVVVAADTGRLLSANVSYDIVSANSWGDYLLDRATGESARVRVTYEYRSNVSVPPVDRNGS